MIDYATLCQAIEDWKAGHQPAAIRSPPPRPAAPAAPVHYADADAEPEPEAEEYAADDEPRPEDVADSTVIYQLPEFVENDDMVVDEDET